MLSQEQCLVLVEAEISRRAGGLSMIVLAVALGATEHRIVLLNVRHPAGSTRRTIGWVSIGIGVVGLAVGGGAGLAALVKQGELDEDQRCPTSCSDASSVDTYNTLRYVSTAGFVVGAVAVAAGVVLLLTAPKGSASSKTLVRQPKRGFASF